MIGKKPDTTYDVVDTITDPELPLALQKRKIKSNKQNPDILLPTVIWRY